MKKLIYFAAIILLCVSCQKDDDTYYKTIGEGYIYDGENNKPIQGATIIVYHQYDDPGWFQTGGRLENLITTDENGYFQFHFLKRTNGKKVYHYYINYDYFDPELLPEYQWTDPSGTLPTYLYPKDLNGKKTIDFGTIKLYLSTYTPSDK